MGLRSLSQPLSDFRAPGVQGGGVTGPTSGTTGTGWMSEARTFWSPGVSSPSHSSFHLPPVRTGHVESGAGRRRRWTIFSPQPLRVEVWSPSPPPWPSVGVLFPRFHPSTRDRRDTQTVSVLSSRPSFLPPQLNNPDPETVQTPLSLCLCNDGTSLPSQR